MRPDPQSFYSELSMYRVASPKLPFVVVEGETDRNLLENKLSIRRPRAEVHVAGNKKTALKVNDLARARQNLNPIVFVLDADFDRFTGRDRQSETVVYTDANDMECTILSVDNVIDRIEPELLPRHVIGEILATASFASLKDLVIDCAWEIGKYRAINDKDNLSLSFRFPEGIGYIDFYQLPGFRWRDDAFRTWVRNNPRNLPQKVDKLFTEVDGTAWSNDKIHLCRGHDVVEILAMIQNHHAESFQFSKWVPNIMGSVFRLQVDETRLRNTRMVSKIMEIVSR